MFGTLLGSLPRPTGNDGSVVANDDEAVSTALEAQLAAGLEPLTDGRLRPHGGLAFVMGLRGVVRGASGLHLAELPVAQGPVTLEAWRFAAAHAQGLVKQTLPGPYTLGRRLGAHDPDGATAAFSQALHAEIAALGDAGCRLIEIEERDAHLIGADDAERRRFADAHLALLAGTEGLHLSLAIVGGNADAAGIATILAAPYSSLAVDLIDGPDNWRLVRQTPGDRGIVCGALSCREPSDEGPELQVWAAAYASSSNDRGTARVGLATAGSMRRLSWPVAIRKMTSLGNAARLAGLPIEEAAPYLDPRAVDIRSAAMGRYAPRTGHRADRPKG